MSLIKAISFALVLAIGVAQPYLGAYNSTAGTRILILGDSWGTVSPATEHFEKELNEHKCPLAGFTNIAIGGTTAEQWSKREKLDEVKKQAANHDQSW